MRYVFFYKMWYMRHVFFIKSRLYEIRIFIGYIISTIKPA